MINHMTRKGRGYLGAGSAVAVDRLELPGVTGASEASGGPEVAAVSPGHKHRGKRVERP